jgi:hypothetical protein
LDIINKSFGEREGKGDRNKDREIHGKTDRQTERKKGRHIGRQNDRGQTDRQVGR